MQLYMTTHKKQQLVNNEWVDVMDYSNYTLFVVANNDDEALAYAKAALMKMSRLRKVVVSDAYMNAIVVRNFIFRKVKQQTFYG